MTDKPKWADLFGMDPGYGIDEEQVTDDRAGHSFPVYAQEERCRCGSPAAHKVEETSSPRDMHPLTAYLCCACFQVIGNCGSHLYAAATPYTEQETTK